jgi:uncharacterized protein
VTLEKLAMIEAAEYVLRDLGFHDVRVRHHELGPKSTHLRNATARQAVQSPKSPAKALPSTLNPQLSTSHLARIELGPAEIPRFLEDDVTTRVTEALKKIGYSHVTLDLQGYRRGGANKAPGRHD